jgi:hypothetical protein
MFGVGESKVITWGPSPCHGELVRAIACTLVAYGFSQDATGVWRTEEVVDKTYGGDLFGWYAVLQGGCR